MKYANHCAIRDICEGEMWRSEYNALDDVQFWLQTDEERAEKRE